MIRVNMICQDTRHPDRRRRHPGRAWCEVAGRRFDAKGPAPIYRITTLLWLHGHSGEPFEVHDDFTPFGRPGGLALTGRVRNWARLVNGRPKFGRDALPEPDFTPGERDIAAMAAGRVAEINSPRLGNGPTGATRPSDAPDYLSVEGGAQRAKIGDQGGLAGLGGGAMALLALLQVNWGMCTISSKQLICWADC